MRMYDLIMDKKRGRILGREAIRFMTEGYTRGEIPDYQMAAMLMAICFNGMTDEETKELTLAMAESGDMLDLSGIQGIKVDKHSTGGVGDKTSLVVGPMVASLGVPVAKMSGRGLGHTGGTIDKLESIEGFHTSLSKEQFMDNVNSIHMAIAAQTANLAPADKKIYALRDVTATVDQMALIASSIMSKKLASGADAIVLDVKTGDGAFMKTPEDSEKLAREMVSIGNLAGRRTVAVISDMDQPLGNMVGNALEVREAIDALRGEGPEDLRELSLTLGTYMVLLAGKADSTEEARKMLERSLSDGSALQTFIDFVGAQGGNISQIKNPELLPQAKIQLEVVSDRAGYVSKILTEETGEICLLLGGGRETKESVIDPAVGIHLIKKKGDAVKNGDILAVIYASDSGKAAEAGERMRKAYQIGDSRPEPVPVIYKIIE